MRNKTGTKRINHIPKLHHLKPSLIKGDIPVITLVEKEIASLLIKRTSLCMRVVKSIARVKELIAIPCFVFPIARLFHRLSYNIG